MECSSAAHRSPACGPGAAFSEGLPKHQDMKNISSYAVLFIVTLCSLTPLAAQAQSQSDSRGLYVYSWDVANTFSPSQTKAPGVAELLAAMKTPGIDGITLVFDWNTIEPGKGTFLWTNATQPTLLDEWIQAAIDAGLEQQKPFHITLAVRAGFGTPCWLFNPGDCPSNYRLYNPNYTGSYAGAAALDLFASAHQGRGKCLEVMMAPPWDGVFQTEWAYMVSQLSMYLKSATYKGVREYDAISTVRLDGMNRTTDEFRIPAEVLTAQECNLPADVNAVQSWLDAGYRPRLIQKAWNQLSDDIVANFGDKIVNVAIIPTDSGNPTDVDSGNGQFPFPPIDENGCVYLRGIPTWARPLFNGECTIPAKVKVPDQNRGLIVLAERKLPETLNVEFENLHFGGNGQPAPASPTVVRYAEKFGSLPAFQTNNYFGQQAGGTSCTSLTNPERCSPSQYLAMLESGINPSSTDLFLHSQLLEVFYPDVNAPECPLENNPPFGCGYPNEILQAHSDIISPPLVAIGFPPASATHWYTQLPLDGQVTATSAIGESISQLDCAGAASGSGPGGFALNVNTQGNPAIVKCTATDAAGHMGESIRALWIDTQPPVTKLEVATTHPETINLVATDKVSGVAQTQYRINGGSWVIGTQVVLGIGTWEIDYFSMDVAGNVEKTRTTTITVEPPSPPPPRCNRQCV